MLFVAAAVGMYGQEPSVTVFDKDGNVCELNGTPLNINASVQVSAPEYAGQQLVICAWLYGKGGTEFKMSKEVQIGIDGTASVFMPEWNPYIDTYGGYDPFQVFTYYAVSLHMPLPAGAAYDLNERLTVSYFEKDAYADVVILDHTGEPINDLPVLAGAKLSVTMYGLEEGDSYGILTWKIVDGEEVYVASKSGIVTQETDVYEMPEWNELEESVSSDLVYCAVATLGSGHIEDATGYAYFKIGAPVFDPNLHLQNNPVPAWGTNIIWDVEDEALIGQTATLAIYSTETGNLVDQLQQTVFSLGTQWLWHSFSNCSVGMYNLILEVGGMPPVSIGFIKQ